MSHDPRVGKNETDFSRPWRGKVPRLLLSPERKHWWQNTCSLPAVTLTVILAFQGLIHLFKFNEISDLRESPPTPAVFKDHMERGPALSQPLIGLADRWYWGTAVTAGKWPLLRGDRYKQTWPLLSVRIPSVGVLPFLGRHPLSLIPLTRDFYVPTSLVFPVHSP